MKKETTFGSAPSTPAQLTPINFFTVRQLGERERFRIGGEEQYLTTGFATHDEAVTAAREFVEKWGETVKILTVTSIVVAKAKVTPVVEK